MHGLGLALERHVGSGLQILTQGLVKEGVVACLHSVINSSVLPLQNAGKNNLPPVKVRLVES